MNVQINPVSLPTSAKAQATDNQPTKDGDKTLSRGDVAVLLILAKVEAKTLQINKDEELSKKERDELSAEQVIAATLQKCKTLDQAKGFLDQLKRLIPKDDKKLTQYVAMKEGIYNDYINDPELKKLQGEVKSTQKHIDKIEKLIDYVRDINDGFADLFDKCSDWNISIDGLSLSKGALEKKLGQYKEAIKGIKGIYLAQMQQNTSNATKGLQQATVNDQNLEGAQEAIKNLSKMGDATTQGK